MTDLSPSFLKNKVHAVVLAGGRGSRLHGLTDRRAKPAVPFGGKYRLIDFALSNCLNSGIDRVGVVTQYMSHSLNQHVTQGWNLTASNGGPLIELLPAQQRTSELAWYNGTADAIYQNMDIVRDHNPDYVLVLAGDHVYHMDYREMITHHCRSGADMTMGTIEYDRSRASDFGVLTTDDAHRVTQFNEKPAEPTPLADNPAMSLVSMGIYVFNAQFLYDQLILDHQRRDTQNDFGKNVIPSLIASHHVSAFRFRNEAGHPAYWRDVGTLDSYWQTSLELIGVIPELNLYNKHWPTRTMASQSPPAKFLFDSHDRCGAAVNSMICDGCIVSGALISDSLISTNVVMNEHTEIRESVILPETVIGERCRIRRAVIDKRCQIPADTVIGFNPDEDRERFHVSDNGIVLVTPAMLEHNAQHPPQAFRSAA